MNNLIVGIILFFIVFGFVAYLVSIYNRIIALKNYTEKSFANIDVLLKQRADGIPQLVSILKASNIFEESVLTRLTEERSRYLNSNNVDEKVPAANNMTESLKYIFAVSENYPKLQSVKLFVQLQQYLGQLEDHIADRREFYNESVALYNIGIQEFPNIVIANLFGYQPKLFLEISEKEKEYAGVAL